MNEIKQSVGVIGLGAMGEPMARNLAQAGMLAGVWNRSTAKAHKLANELAVPVAANVLELAQSCACILTCVSADNDLLAVIEALQPGLSAGKLVIDTSTVRPSTARQLADQLSKVGCGFLDAPVSGGVEGAKQASLSIMVGGEQALLARALPVLRVIGQRITHMGPVGSGQATKAVNQVMAAGINQAVTEALALAEAQGLPVDKVLEVVRAGAAGNWFVDKRGASMLRGEYAPGFKLALHHKDLAICQTIAQDYGVALPVVEMTLIHYRRLMEAGFGEEDISALFREKRRLFSERAQ